MNQLLRFSGSVKRDPAIETWMKAHTGDLGMIAQPWFEVMRRCGDDVRELLHDSHPTACIADATIGYVNAFKAHVNVGFFRGAEIADPERLLEGTGKFMRHVKLRPDRDFKSKHILSGQLRGGRIMMAANDEDKARFQNRGRNDGDLRWHVGRGPVARPLRFPPNG